MIMMIYDEREYSWGSMRDKVIWQRKGIWDMGCELNERCEMKWLCYYSEICPPQNLGLKFDLIEKKMNIQIVGRLYASKHLYMLKLQ